MTGIQNTNEMSDMEFWQRVALEAIVNKDSSKALAMRLEEFFDNAVCYPRQKNCVRVKGVDEKSVFEWLETSEFDYSKIENDGLSGFLIRGIEYNEYNEFK